MISMYVCRPIGWFAVTTESIIFVLVPKQGFSTKVSIMSFVVAPFIILNIEFLKYRKGDNISHFGNNAHVKGI